MYVAWGCPLGLHRICVLFFVVGVVSVGGASAADRDEAEKLFRTGRYDECVRQVDEEIASDAWSEPLRRLKIKSQLARGKYSEALATLEEALTRFPASIALHLLGRDVYHWNGNDRDAAGELGAIDRLIQGGARRYATAEGFVSIGRFFLLRGTDARKVLDQFYDVVTKQQPDFVDAYYATAELALEKQDYALAAETLRKAPKAASEDPRFHYLLARALGRRGSRRLCQGARRSPQDQPAPCRQPVAQGRSTHRRRAVSRRPTRSSSRCSTSIRRKPRAWAYRAVLAHLRGDKEGEANARRTALAQWSTNPEVDHLIGRKLSPKYRFAEGAAFQKQALGLDADYHPAKVQLCQDLLAAGRRGGGLEAGCRDLQQGWL